MADNVVANSIPVATRSVTYSGDASQNVQVVGLATFSGADDAKTATDVPAGNGTAATALRVTIASDSTGVVALAAGTNNIGDVDVLTVPAPLSTTGNGTAATALRVTVASDSTGVLSVTESTTITDNAGFTDGASKVFMAGFAFDEVAGTALTENDAAAARIDSKRAQVLVIEDATTRGRRATVSAAGAVVVDGSAVTQPVSGTVTANAGTGTMTVSAGQTPHSVGVTMASVMLKVTTTQTSANIIAGTGGQRIYVSSITIATGGTTAGEVGIYWGTGTLATAVTNGTVLFDGEFAPSATVRPGYAQSFPIPLGAVSATGDNLRITTSAAMTVYVTVHYYKA